MHILLTIILSASDRCLSPSDGLVKYIYTAIYGRLPVECRTVFNVSSF